MFLSRAQTQNFLDADADGFIARLSPFDLEARHVRTNGEYLEKAIKSAGTFSESECEALIREARRADAFLIGSRYSGVPWRFAKAAYEEGLPHTRGPVIFLTGPVEAATLVHERVHVIQKLKGPQIPPGYSLTDLHYKNLRANPDTDGRVWTLNGQRADAYYRTTRPMGIQDVVQHVEHPFEAEAYAVSNAFRPNARWNM